MLGVDRVYQVVAGEVLQPLPKESRFGFVDDALWRAQGLCHVRPFYLSIADGGRNPQLEYQCVRVVVAGPKQRESYLYMANVTTPFRRLS